MHGIKAITLFGVLYKYVEVISVCQRFCIWLNNQMLF